MAAPGGHDRSPKNRTEEEEDPVETMINKTGCAQYHYAVQDCMFEKQDWRKCREEVETFKTCIMNSRSAQQNSGGAGKPS